MKRNKKALLTLVLIPVSLYIVKHLFIDSVPSFFHSKTYKTEIKMKDIEYNIFLFYSKNGFYPKNLEGMQQQGINKLLDDWGQKIIYESDGENFKIISYAADKKTGGIGESKDIIISNGK